MPKAAKFDTAALKQAMTAEWKKFVSKPRCWRCGGFMVIEQCLYLLKMSGYNDLLSRRCVQCGELVDPIILWNRQHPLGATRKDNLKKAGNQ